jgi:hypothetical protein
MSVLRLGDVASYVYLPSRPFSDRASDAARRGDSDPEAGEGDAEAGEEGGGLFDDEL